MLPRSNRQVHLLSTYSFRRKQRLRLFAVAGAGFCSALLLTGLVLMINQNRSVARFDPHPPLIPVVRTTDHTVTLFAPRHPVQAGDSLQNVRFESILWPRSTVAKDAIRDLAELKGKFAKYNLPANTPISRNHVTSDIAPDPLNVPVGYRALSIATNAITSIEGHAQPGTRVDVVLTTTRPEVKSEIIVENAVVASKGGNPERDMLNEHPTGYRAKPDKTITLFVLPLEALSILNAQKLGSISLIMRADNRPLQKKSVRGDEITKHERKKPKSARLSCGKIKIEGERFDIDCSTNRPFRLD